MSTHTEDFCTTTEAANLLGLKSTTIHHRLWAHGHLYGVVPVRAVNGRLKFPANAIRDLQRKLLVGTEVQA